MKVEQLEAILGPAEDYVYRYGDRETLRDWAIAKGSSPLDLASWSNVQLTNLYHERGPKRNAAPPVDQGTLDRADMVVRILQAMDAGVATVPMLREMIRQEIPTADMLRKLAQDVYDALPARRMEFVTPAGSVTLNGPLHARTERVIQVCSLGHPVMMVGPAGCGKTAIGAHAAKALQLPFYITSAVNDTHELMGFVDGYGNYRRTPFREAFENGGVWVADEIDAWDAAALLVANSALANGFAAFPDATAPVKRHANFRMIATANTFGNGANRIYVGRTELDAASLDRFAMITVDYDPTLEQHLCGGNPTWLHRVWNVRKQVEEKRIRHVVSMRAIINGAEALNARIPQNEVEEMYLFKGMSETDRGKLS